jgi:fructose-1,6-bisphosphatase/inositol monophosphatase family enzyme
VENTRAQLERARRLICSLQDHVRVALIAARSRGVRKLARIAGVTAADTIYQIDRISEGVILAWFEAHWPRTWPVELVMEGMEDGIAVTFPRGTPVVQTRFKCILDPIDGTRNLMYDKRSAWMLTGLASQRGSRTGLGDILVAVMTELPTSKQGWADQLSAIRGRGRAGLRAERRDLRTGARKKFRPQPSRARDCRHGFSSFVRFFPEGKALTAQIEEDLWAELYGGPDGSAVIFDDQYLTTGGQLNELLIGHDRMIADIRPLIFDYLGLRSALVCHPYDICTALILTEAGGVVEAPSGEAVKAPLDTTTPVAWVGYANPALARVIRPVLRRLLARRLAPRA